MSKLIAKLAGFFGNRSLVGIDKAGNRYFARSEVIDGVMKEKRWVTFKGEQDPTSIPVEWICWLNGQRKRPPTPEEMAEMEARREFVRQNVERLKKEEEERKLRAGTTRKGAIPGKAEGPNLQSFLQQMPSASEGVKLKEPFEAAVDVSSTSEGTEPEKSGPVQENSPPPPPETTEPTGSGPSFKPGTWQPPT